MGFTDRVQKSNKKVTKSAKNDFSEVDGEGKNLQVFPLIIGPIPSPSTEKGDDEGFCR